MTELIQVSCFTIRAFGSAQDLRTLGFAGIVSTGDCLPLLFKRTHEASLVYTGRDGQPQTMQEFAEWCDFYKYKALSKDLAVDITSTCQVVYLTQAELDAADAHAKEECGRPLSRKG